jgi:hypothetical protein
MLRFACSGMLRSEVPSDAQLLRVVCALPSLARLAVDSPALLDHVESCWALVCIASFALHRLAGDRLRHALPSADMPCQACIAMPSLAEPRVARARHASCRHEEQWFAWPAGLR